jgi:DNA replication protein DnaC
MPPICPAMKLPPHPTMNDELKLKLHYLRLGNLLTHWEDYLSLAAQKNFSQAHLLTYVVEEEYRLKQQHARQLRRQRARVPHAWAIETYPFERQPKLNKKALLALYDSLSFMPAHQNIVWLGITGCGKTGLATSFLLHALDQGYNGRYVLFADLVGELYQSVADHSQAQVLKSYLTWDCLLIDEIGYVEVEPVQVGLFFTLMHQRHQRKSTLITSNLGFSEWGAFLKNDHLTAALADRLTQNSHIFNMKGCVGLREPLPSAA